MVSAIVELSIIKVKRNPKRNLQREEKTKPAENQRISICVSGENKIRFFLESFESFSLVSRREQDSNLRTGFAGYTLSRRASSTTRAPLLAFCGCKGSIFNEE